VYLEKEPGAPALREVVYPLGQAYEKLGDFAGAKEVYRRFISMGDPNDPRVKRAQVWLESIEQKNNQE